MAQRDGAVTGSGPAGCHGQVDREPSVPGPILRTTEGEDLEITLDNSAGKRGHRLHFHGAQTTWENDGVPTTIAITVGPGETHTDDIPANVPRTHLYHCHFQTHRHPVIVRSPAIDRSLHPASPRQPTTVDALRHRPRPPPVVLGVRRFTTGGCCAGECRGAVPRSVLAIHRHRPDRGPFRPAGVAGARRQRRRIAVIHGPT